MLKFVMLRVIVIVLSVPEWIEITIMVINVVTLTLIKHFFYHSTLQLLNYTF